MKDYNKDGKIDREDYQIFEDLNNKQNIQGNTTIPAIIVAMIVIGLLIFLKLH